jgi:glutaredoxin 3
MSEQKKVKIYTTSYCGYCDSAKRFFEQKNIAYEAIDISSDHDLRQELSTKHKWRTVPMIFIGDEFVGGFQDLIKLESKGELENKLSISP